MGSHPSQKELKAPIRCVDRSQLSDGHFAGWYQPFFCLGPSLENTPRIENRQKAEIRVVRKAAAPRP